MILLAFLAVSLVACSRPGNQNKKNGANSATAGKDEGKPGDKKPKEFLTPVVAKKIMRGQMLVTVATTANVIPVRSEAVQSMESGIVVFTKAWHEGQKVTSGTLIATLDNDSLRQQYDTAKADLEIQQQTLDIQKVRLRQASNEYVITQDLYAKGLAPLKDVETNKLQLANAQNSLEQARINLLKSKVALQAIEQRFGFLKIRAPFSGMLVSRSTIQGKSTMAKAFGTEPLRVLEGRYVSQATDLFGMMDISKVYLKCDVTSKDIAKIRLGEKADGVVYGRQNISVSGKVVSVSSNVNPDTRAFEVYVLVPNPDSRLLPGMFGRVEIIVQRLEDVISIPKTIVQRRGEKDVVFLVSRPPSLPYPVAKQTPVDLGVESRDDVEVTNGIRNGDEVVVRGYEILRDQIPLQVADADQPTS